MGSYPYDEMPEPPTAWGQGSPVGTSPVVMTIPFLLPKCSKHHAGARQCHQVSQSLDTSAECYCHPPSSVCLLKRMGEAAGEQGHGTVPCPQPHVPVEGASYPQSSQPHTGDLRSSRRSSWPLYHSPLLPHPSRSPGDRDHCGLMGGSGPMTGRFGVDDPQG